MNLLYFTIFGLVVFVSILLGGRKYRTTTLYALAIGGAVNANFFNSFVYPINIFGITFGIDSIIYTLFLFCVILMFFLRGKKEAYLLSISSLIAIMISAIFDLVSKFLSSGYYNGIFNVIFDFSVSCFWSLIIVIIALEVLDKVYKTYKNQYVLTTLSLLGALIINTPIFYTLVPLINGTPDNIIAPLLGSVIGKLIATAFALLALYLIKLWDKNKQEKETINHE